MYLSRNGGYWRQPLNDRDYTFDLYLAPKPYADAVPRWRIEAMTGTLPFLPVVTPQPTYAPRSLRVTVPMQGSGTHPEQYGFRIWGGWSDPNRSESSSIQRVRVHLDTIFMDGDYDRLGDEWYVYVGVNGRWHRWQSIGGSSESVSFTVDLDLHPTDRIKVTACGFEADAMHGYMGDNSGYSWSTISNPSISRSDREAIEDHVFWQLSGSLSDENDEIGYLVTELSPRTRGTIVTRSDKRHYRLRYSVSNR